MDAFLFEKINGLALENLLLDNLVVFLAEYLPYLLVIFLILLLLLNFRKYWRIVVLSLSAGFLSRGITELIRIAWNRPRPFVENDVNLLIDHLKSYSFPSAHTAFFFAVAGAILFYNKKLGAVFFISAIFISISRVYSGVHWPSDILGGFLVGILSALLTSAFSKKWKKNNILKEQTP